MTMPLELLATDTSRLDILGMDSDTFLEHSTASGIPRKRALIAYRTLFREGHVDEDWFSVGSRPVNRHETSGGTIKFTMSLNDGHETESVLIPMRARDGSTTRTLCVSSQVGCAMGCTFCETGQMGLVRNLSASEIVAQWFAATHELGETVKNIVFMGMGEPMDNLDEVIKAIRTLVDHNGPSIPSAKISVSTVGRIDGINRLAELVREPGFHRLNLAVSVNAPDDRIRTELMPINKAMNLEALRKALLAFPLRRGAALLIEYVLIPGVNDSNDHCDRLCDWLAPLRCSLNVIPYNPRRDSPWPAPDEGDVDRFITRAISNGQFVKRRGTKGRDLMAACGQLGNPGIRRRRGSRRADTIQPGTETA